jgi:hypothetical protein
MNIIIICQWFPLEYAPIGVMLYELAQYPTNMGHTLTIVTGYPNHPEGVLFRDGARPSKKRSHLEFLCYYPIYPSIGNKPRIV